MPLGPKCELGRRYLAQHQSDTLNSIRGAILHSLGNLDLPCSEFDFHRSLHGGAILPARLPGLSKVAAPGAAEEPSEEILNLPARIRASDCGQLPEAISVMELSARA